MLGACHVRESCGDGPVITLDTVLEEGGRNWSVGQRQLLCLGRALLHQAKIVCVDEATASVCVCRPRRLFSASCERVLLVRLCVWGEGQVDSRTDALIQDTLATQFRHATVLEIAHRVSTLDACDRIITVDHGRVVADDVRHVPQ